MIRRKKKKTYNNLKKQKKNAYLCNQEWRFCNNTKKIFNNNKNKNEKEKKKWEERKIDRCYESWEGHPMTNNVPEACINCTNIF